MLPWHTIPLQLLSEGTGSRSQGGQQWCLKVFNVRNMHTPIWALYPVQSISYRQGWSSWSDIQTGTQTREVMRQTKFCNYKLPTVCEVTGNLPLLQPAQPWRSYLASESVINKARVWICTLGISGQTQHCTNWALMVASNSVSKWLLLVVHDLGIHNHNMALPKHRLHAVVFRVLKLKVLLQPHKTHPLDPSSQFVSQFGNPRLGLNLNWSFWFSFTKVVMILNYMHCILKIYILYLLWKWITRVSPTLLESLVWIYMRWRL